MRLKTPEHWHQEEAAKSQPSQLLSENNWAVCGMSESSEKCLNSDRNFIAGGYYSL